MIPATQIWKLVKLAGKVASPVLDFACWLEQKAEERRWERAKLARARRIQSERYRAASNVDPTLRLQVKLPKEPK